MPLVKLSMIEGRTREEKRVVADALHMALVKSFKIPENDWNIRFDEYKRQDYILPPGKSEKYMLAEITAFEGRSAGAKRLLYTSIVNNLQILGIDAADIAIVIYDVPLENWGLRGGIPACDLDLGFDINV